MIFEGRTLADEEIRPLTGLRGLLAWWVVLFHFVRPLLPDGALRQLVTTGHIAVDVFFTLSGYVLARRYIDADFTVRRTRRVFWARRFARIYPLYLCSLLMGFAAAWPKSEAALHTTHGLARVLLQVLGLNAWSHIAMFAHNWAAWSLSVEIFFYASFPFFFVRLKRTSKPRLLALFFVSWTATLLVPALYSVLDPDHLGRSLVLGDEALWAWYLKFFPLQRLPEFIAGAIAALLVQGRDRPAAGQSPLIRTALAAGSAVALVSVAAFVHLPFAFAHSGVLLPLIVALVISLDHENSSWLTTGALIRLGCASYATYILHVPLFFLVAKFGRADSSPPSHVAAYAFLLLVLSLAAHHFVEEPMRRRISHRLASSARPQHDGLKFKETT